MDLLLALFFYRDNLMKKESVKKDFKNLKLFKSIISFFSFYLSLQRFYWQHILKLRLENNIKLDTRRFLPVNKLSNKHLMRCYVSSHAATHHILSFPNYLLLHKQGFCNWVLDFPVNNFVHGTSLLISCSLF